MVSSSVEASDLEAQALRDLVRRSTPGTAGHLAGLVYFELTLADAEGFPARAVIAIFVSLLVVRAAAYLMVMRSRGSRRVRWGLVAFGSIAMNVMWGLVVASVQIRTGASQQAITMAFFVCAVAAGGVNAYAPSPAIQRASLAVLLAPVIMFGVAGFGSGAFAIMHGMFFGYMLTMGRGTCRDYWAALRAQQLLHRHAASAQLAAVTAEAAAHELRTEIAYRSAVEVELRHAQKLEAIGRLAAGIAHEINTPVQFVSDSCRFLGDGIEALGAALVGYRGIVGELADAQLAPARARLAAQRVDDDHDVAYLIDNLPAATARALDGLDRVAKIVAATKEFAYPHVKEKALADVNQGILSTLVISHNETKYVAEVHTELGELPMVLCHCGELNQVMLNLIVNAAHAIGDVVKHTGGLGAIRIKTWTAGDAIRISVGDTGAGIAPEILDKIFEPFFTTKPVGSGSGQGLAIARSVVVDKHGGTLDVSSELGVGTTFTIALPIGGSARAAS